MQGALASMSTLVRETHAAAADVAAAADGDAEQQQRRQRLLRVNTSLARQEAAR